MCGWAPAALLPVFQILGTEYRKKVITTKFLDEAANMDAFTKIDFTYDDAVASIKVAKAAKSEGELIVTGTKLSNHRQLKKEKKREQEPIR